MKLDENWKQVGTVAKEVVRKLGVLLASRASSKATEKTKEGPLPP